MPIPRKMVFEREFAKRRSDSSREFTKHRSDSSRDYRQGPRQRNIANRIRASSVNESNFDTKYGWNSLAKAVTHNNVDALYAILKEPETDVNQEYSHGWTPLLIAVQKSNLTITEILLEHNANVDKQNHAGISALHEGARRNNLKMVQKLLDWRANPLVLDRFGRPPRSKNVKQINDLIQRERFKWRLNHIICVRQLPFIQDIQWLILKYLH